MKYVSTMIFITFLMVNASAQKAMTFGEAKKKGVEISELEKLYHNGLHDDSTLVVFPNQNEFLDAYKNLLQDFGKHLTKEGFLWDKPTMCFNRIYFDKNGKIDYFLYNFSSGQITKKRERQFKRLLNSFIKEYMFPLNAKVNFAQCCPVNYQPQKKSLD